MNEEQKKAFTDSGEQAACLYNGAYKVFKNNKSAERIVFLFFSALIFGNDKTITMFFDMFGDKE